MKSEYVVKVYILTDSMGEWWLLQDKRFPSLERAKEYANKNFLNRKFQVVFREPPRPPSRVYEETIVYEQESSHEHAKTPK